MTVSLEVPAEILAERARQIAGEGWTPEHDDQHDNGELLAVAMLYWQRSVGVAVPTEVLHYNRWLQLLPWRNPVIGGISFRVPVGFPWQPWWWKPKTARRDLERAGGLCLAEIERLKRAGRAVGHVEQKLDWIIEAYNGLAPASGDQ